MAYASMSAEEYAVQVGRTKEERADPRNCDGKKAVSAPDREPHS